MKYIPADKLVEHLHKMLEKYPKNYQILVILEFIDSLQQEQSGVDLEKEIKDKYSRDTSTLKTREEYAKLARYFYELGLNARKEE